MLTNQPVAYKKLPTDHAYTSMRKQASKHEKFDSRAVQVHSPNGYLLRYQGYDDISTFSYHDPLVMNDIGG